MGLQSQFHAWVNIGAPKTVLNWIQHGVQLPFIYEPPATRLSNKPLGTVQEKFIDCEITQLLANNVIEVSYDSHFISPIQAVPKKGKNKWRLITDLRILNTFVSPPKFTNEGIHEAQGLIEQNDDIITIDLKDGFYHIPVAHEHRKFLCFVWRGVTYQWCKLCFGLNASPYFFAKTIRPVLTYLRSKNLRVTVYVDDWVLMANPDKIQCHKSTILDTLEKLGWRVNWTKSSLAPEKSKVWIGYILSSTMSNGEPGIKIPHSRIIRLRKDIRRLLTQGYASARILARIAGQCVAMSEVVLPAKLLLRNVYRLITSKTSWSTMLHLTPEARKDLEWWMIALTNWNGRPTARREIDLQITTDASSTGWGAWMGEHQAAGFWTTGLSLMPSNYRELMAVQLALHSFLPNIRYKYVQIVSDNISTVAYLNNLGGPSKDLSSLATSIWALAYREGIHLTARYLAGSQNTEADRLSRLNPKYEWSLNSAIFQWLDKMWGKHTIDRFATMLNAQTLRYNSRFFDPLTEAVDALAQQNWSQENNFCNPPFRLLPRVLQVIKEQHAYATVIAPHWPTQPWYRRLQRMAIAPPVPITMSPRAILASVGKPEPLRNRHWRLLAWRVYGGSA